MKRILVVDDEALITHILCKRLEANGYNTFKAYDGGQCLSMAQQIKPDLILLDIVMPLGDGFTAFKNLRLNLNTEKIPIIFITAYDDNETKSKISELDPDGFFTKPYDGNKLLIKINELIGS